MMPSSAMILLASFLIFSLAALLMSLGFLIAGRRLRGSCGGTGAGTCPCGPVEQRACPKKALDVATGEHRNLR